VIDRGLASPVEQKMIDDYMKGLARLRSAIQERRAAESAATDQHRVMTRAQRHITQARTALIEIENRALGRDTAQLFEDLDPLIEWRKSLEKGWFTDDGAFETTVKNLEGIDQVARTSVGLRLDCQASAAVKAAGLRLRDATEEEIRAAMRGQRIVVDISPRRERGVIVAAGRLEWSSTTRAGS
jgi:hypothetical protein